MEGINQEENPKAKLMLLFLTSEVGKRKSKGQREINSKVQVPGFRLLTSDFRGGNVEAEVRKRKCGRGKVCSEIAILDVEWKIEWQNNWYSGSKPEMKVGE